ncbi:MAG TPA: PAS domain-containing sensor histidine kinase [Terracidiphilus sp.]|jgi:two-component system sensor histidine kinase FlrB|nr:PAS domain-containing sensor histidine kinase [Terracidiphilus sp.]
MLPSSHVVPINQAPAAARISNPRMLADAFSEFISASAQLESSYRDLQTKVAHLSTELADRNAALTRSLAENDRMRAALQQIIDSMPCGVLVLNTVETIVMINPECRRLLALGSIHVTTLRDLSAASRIDFEALAASDDRRDTEICVPAETGKRWLEIGKRELICLPQKQEPSTAPLRSIWILRDVTASKQAELEREAARHAATLAEISSILAHEIRNPLASLELFAGLIAEDNGANPQWIAHLRAGIRTLSGTVNNVLSMNGEGTPQCVDLDLISSVRDGVEFVQPIAEQAGVVLTFSAQADALAIRGNQDGIRQIILNLIRNAIRHTPAGGSVSVTARAAAAQAIVEVRDTGCGIPVEQIGRLFEAGFSGTGATPGLGLAVCKRLMAQHGGAIHVASQLNQGSSFQLEFPAL